MLSEIRDMTDEESSINQDECKSIVLDHSNQFEISRGIKWNELVILLKIINLNIGLVETLRGFKWLGTTN